MLSLKDNSAASLRIWSASPTPFLADLTLDKESVTRLIEHHVRLGCEGIFLCGTCGEGPWMPDRQKLSLVQTARAVAGGRLRLAVQVTENSAARVLEQISALGEIDLAVVAQPYLAMNTSASVLRRYYLEILDRSPVPVCYYERGKASVVSVPKEVLHAILPHPNLRMVKDSSGDPQRRSLLLAARKQRADLTLLLGDEFLCLDYLTAGYDGVMLGGAVLNACYVAEIMRHLKQNNVPAARQTERRMIDFLYGIYGGPKVTCWLNGLKTTLVQLGIFRTNAAYLDYPLTSECSATINRLIVSEREYLLPS